MLEARRLNAGYGAARVLFDVELAARRGEVVALLGRNGAGKSTTLKTLMGLIRPFSGEVHFDGRRIDAWEPYEVARAGLGYVPEDRRIFTDLTVAENLEVGRQPPREATPAWSPEKLFQLFPALQALQGRRAANAVHCAHAGGKPESDPARRAFRRAGADDRGAGREGDPRIEARRRVRAAERAESLLCTPRGRPGLCARAGTDPSGLCGLSAMPGCRWRRRSPRSRSNRSPGG